jgi:hypothetical protein
MKTITKEQKFKKGISFESYIADWFQKEKGISLSTYHAHNEQRKGENRQGVEIKNDQLFKDTGNLFISVKRQYGSLMINWGVFKEDNTWLYVIGDKSKHWIFLRKNLQRYFVVKQPILKKVAIEKNGYEYGFLLPCDIADNMADYYSNQLKLEL